MKGDLLEKTTNVRSFVAVFMWGAMVINYLDRSVLQEAHG
jgi:hypothetical protein